MYLTSHTMTHNPPATPHKTVLVLFHHQSFQPSSYFEQRRSTPPPNSIPGVSTAVPQQQPIIVVGHSVLTCIILHHHPDLVLTVSDGESDPKYPLLTEPVARQHSLMNPTSPRGIIGLRKTILFDVVLSLHLPNLYYAHATRPHSGPGSH